MSQLSKLGVFGMIIWAVIFQIGPIFIHQKITGIALYVGYGIIILSILALMGDALMPKKEEMEL